MPRNEIRLITVLLIAIIGLTDMGTDIYIPTLPILVDYFGSSEKAISYTLTASFLGFCVAAPLYGPLSDTFGRRNLFLLGLIIFTIGNLISFLAFSVEMLVFARFVTGVGITVGYVVGVAVVKDLYRKEEYSKVMSFIHMSVTLAPAISPIIGSYLSVYYGWQSIFILLSVCGVILLLYTLKMPETLKPEKRKPLNVRSLVKTYGMIVRNYKFLGYASISGIVYAGLWLYYAEIPYIFDRLFIPTIYFGYYQAFLALTLILGSYFNSKTVLIYGVDALFKFSLSMAFLGSLLFLVFSFYMPKSSYGIYLSFSLYAFSLGGIFANASTCAMDQFSDQTGFSSSALSCIESLIPAIFLFIMAPFFNQTPFPVAIGVFVGSCLALLIHNLIKDDIKTSASELEPVEEAA